MRNRTKNILGIVVSVVGVCTLVVGAADAGSSSDPLITKSYLEARLKETGSNESIKSLTETVKAQQEVIDTLNEELKDLKEKSASTYEIVSVPAGKSILGAQGLELIIRGGEGKAIASAAGGLQNITAGNDIKGGANAPKNHLLVVPKEDGRGVFAVQNLILMVRGRYTIQ